MEPNPSMDTLTMVLIKGALADESEIQAKLKDYQLDFLYCLRLLKVITVITVNAERQQKRTGRVLTGLSISKSGLLSVR